MKENDLVKVDLGVARVLCCSSSKPYGVEVWSAHVEYSDGLRAFVWGRFRLRKGVWVRIAKNPFA